MAFKGTSDRTAAQIASDIENVGGFMNAYTSREETAYFIRLLPDEVALGVDLLCDILTDSQLPAHEIERERGVIIQEIGQSQDTPDDIVFDMFAEASYSGHTLGRPILGSIDSVSGFSRDDLRAFMGRYYGAGQMLVTASGAVDHDDFVSRVDARLEGHLRRRRRSVCANLFAAARLRHARLCPHRRTSFGGVRWIFSRSSA